MTPEVFHSVCYKIANANIRPYPYPHFFIESLFPEPFYQELLSFLPETACYQKLSETGKTSGTYDKRYIFPLEEEEFAKLSLPDLFFWQKFAFYLNHPVFINLLIEKFKKEILARFDRHFSSLKFLSVAELIRDYQYYSIGPHTDHPARVVTLLFYLPQDDQKRHLGTSLYQPSDSNFTCEGFKHHSFEGFINVQTMPYLPNSLFGFVKTDRSFHGVEPLQEENSERNLMNFYVRWEKL
jgi:hypothetical protein